MGMTNCMFILEGRAALDLDGEMSELKPGTVVFIPVAHPCDS